MAWRKASGTAFVTALPSSPVDGQEVYYQADGTNGVIWHLRYRAASASTYKWEFVGGSDLAATAATVSAAVSITANTWASPWTAISLTAPLAGEYTALFSTSVSHGATGGYVEAGLKVGSTEPVLDNNAAVYTAATYNSVSLGRVITLTKVTPGTTDVVTPRLYTQSTHNVGRFNTILTITPIRVG